MSRRAAGRALALAATLGIAACAKPVFPPGGPLDTTPPHVVVASPADSSVRVPPDAGLEILFSEGMERASVRDGIRAYPPPGEPAFHWRGRRLRVSWDEPLRPVTTYQVLLSGGMRDLHGVPLGRPIAIRFTTGDSLDPGVLVGALRAKTLPTRGVPIVVFPDSLGLVPDFASVRPAYATETDTAAAFRLSGLPLHQGFTVHASYDLNRNGSYEPESDVIASAPAAIRLTPAHPVTDSLFLLAVDPRAPALVSGGIASRDSTARFQVEARADSDSVRVARVQRQGPGAYTLRVPPGRYRLIATRLPGPDGDPPPIVLRVAEILDARAEAEYPQVDFDFREQEPTVPGADPPEPPSEE